MKMLWKLTKEAARYKGLYVIAILSTLLLTVINLIAPKILSSMTGIVEKGTDNDGLRLIMMLAFRLLFSISSSYSIQIYEQLSYP